jgi:hypothetical protein
MANSILASLSWLRAWNIAIGVVDGHVCLFLCDEDVSSHVRGLVISYLYQIVPSLFRVKEGIVQVTVPIEVEIYASDKLVWFMDNAIFRNIGWSRFKEELVQLLREVKYEVPIERPLNTYHPIFAETDGEDKQMRKIKAYRLDLLPWIK